MKELEGAQEKDEKTDRSDAVSRYVSEFKQNSGYGTSKYEILTTKVMTSFGYDICAQIISGRAMFLFSFFWGTR
ncbi:MAG: hypothetical protein R6U56_02665 [Opitutales bacterium]